MRQAATAMAGVNGASRSALLFLSVSLAAGANIRKYRQVNPSFHTDLLDSHVTSFDLSNVVYSFACADKCSRNSCCRLACQNGSDCQLYDIKVADHWTGFDDPSAVTFNSCITAWVPDSRPVLPTNLSASSVSEGSDIRKSVDGFISKNQSHCFSTDEEANPWWLADLGSVRRVAQIRVLTRQDGNASEFVSVVVRFGNSSALLRNGSEQVCFDASPFSELTENSSQLNISANISGNVSDPFPPGNTSDTNLANLTESNLSGNENASYPNGSVNSGNQTFQGNSSAQLLQSEPGSCHPLKDTNETEPAFNSNPVFDYIAENLPLGAEVVFTPEEPVSGRYLSLQSLDPDPANVLTICNVEILEQQREPIMRNCQDVKDKLSDVSGVYTIYPRECCPVSVYCDMDTDGGGWTVIQQRRDALPREDFYRPWSDYALGFGHSPCGEFWLGLEHIHALADQRPNELRIDLEDFVGATRWAKYSAFYVGDREDLYTLAISGYEGNAGDAMTAHDGSRFSTKDYDNDKDPSRHCAQTCEGGWWYSSICHYANLNGKYLSGSHKSFGNGINWYQWRGYYYSLKSTTMMIRPVPEVLK